MSKRMVAVLVTGDRNCREDHWSDIVESALSRQGFWHADQSVLIHGDNGVFDSGMNRWIGLDTIAARVVRARRLSNAILPMPFMEDVGRSGGPRRNEQMVRVLTALREVGYETVCLAFHDQIAWSKGTKDCHNRALRAGHPCFVITSFGVETRSEATV